LATEISKGDKIRVRSHQISIGGVKVLVEGFTGTFINEYTGTDGKAYANVSGNSVHAGYRTVLLEHISHLNENEETPNFDGASYTIRCVECYEARKISPQNLGKVRRCIACQKKHDRLTARERSKQRKKSK
jgi:hypothetical protein